MANLNGLRELFAASTFLADDNELQISVTCKISLLVSQDLVFCYKKSSLLANNNFPNFDTFYFSTNCK